MNSARLSPAANLLRNSKLFALPPAVPLPPVKPTVDVVFRSDTATTVHPTNAAIYTDSPSLLQGDWGLKRPLPGKAFHRTTTPVIRLRSDVDTQEHIADFESAADHVLTLQKWQNYPLVMTSGFSANKSLPSHWSAFHPTYDNITAGPPPLPAAEAPQVIASGNWNNTERQKFLGTSSDAASNGVSTDDTSVSLLDILEQYKRDFVAEAEASGRAIPPPSARTPPVREVPRRWRYEGPWIAGMTSMDFELFLKQLDGEKIGAFREHLKKGIIARRQLEHAEAVRAAQAEEQHAPEAPSLEVSSEQMDNHLRTLREDTLSFAVEIASFLDLPDSLVENSGDRSWTRPAAQQTAASAMHQKNGPPRTHPSAGFSYLRSARYATMSPKFGPQNPQHLIPARHLKQLPYAGSEHRNQWGVGGFVVSIGQTGSRADHAVWRTTNGGPKTAASIVNAYVASDGSIQLKANLNGGRLDEGNMAVIPGDRPIESYPRGSSRMPQLDHDDSRRLSGGRRTPDLYARSMSSRASSSANPMDDLDGMFRRS